MAVRPSQLGEFRSLEQLDIKEERIMELIYQAKHSIMEEEIRSGVITNFVGSIEISKVSVELTYFTSGIAKSLSMEHSTTFPGSLSKMTLVVADNLSQSATVPFSFVE